ncbi:MAG: hypothetical protein ACPGOT_02885, partial [Candidatus Poseidoniaceae archaeon]
EIAVCWSKISESDLSLQYNGGSWDCFAKCPDCGCLLWFVDGSNGVYKWEWPERWDADSVAFFLEGFNLG